MGNSNKKNKIQNFENNSLIIQNNYLDPTIVFNNKLTEYSPFYSNFYYFCQWMTYFNFYKNYYKYYNENYENINNPDFPNLQTMKNGPNDFNVFRIIKAIDNLKVAKFEDFNYKELMILNDEVIEDVDNLENNLNLHNKELIEKIYIILTDVYDNAYKKYCSILYHGPPNNLRWICWFNLAVINYSDSKFDDLIKENEEIYNKLVNKKIKRKFSRAINNDLKEWFYRYGEVRFGTLFNILKVFYLYFKQLDYEHGMDKIAGYFYIISDFNEFETFFLLRYLYSKNYGLKYEEFFLKNRSFLNLFIFTIRQLLKERIPKIYFKIKKFSIDDDNWLLNWYKFLFTQQFNFSIVVRIIDCIFAYGLEYLYNITLAIIKINEKKLLETFNEMDFINVFTQIKFESEKEIVDYRENIIKISKEFHISKEIFEHIKKKFFQTDICDKDYFNQIELEEKKSDKNDNEEYKFIENIIKKINNGKNKNEEYESELNENEKKSFINSNNSNSNNSNDESNSNNNNSNTQNKLSPNETNENLFLNNSEKEKEIKEENFKLFGNLDMKSEHTPILLFYNNNNNNESNIENNNNNENKNIEGFLNSIQKDETLNDISFEI